MGMVKSEIHSYTAEEAADIRMPAYLLREYIEPLLLERQGGACAACREVKAFYDIDHLEYHPKITLNHLQLLCRACHSKKHPNIGFLRKERRTKDLS